MPKRRVMRGLLVIVIVAGLLGGCGEMRPMGNRSDLIHYTVKQGDTLYSISWRYGYDHREVAAWNSIPPPYTIYPGQQLLIIAPYQADPRELPASQAAQTSTTASASTQSGTASQVPPRMVGRTAAVSRPLPTTSGTTRNTSRQVLEKDTARLQSKSIHWRWPTNGNLLNKYAPNDGKKGLDIAGKLGQPILAAAGGRVVYSGNGLIGYGNLIIIKHNDHYLSAYGHNRRLLVKEGAEVKQGEKIGEMGDSGKDGIILHFEIRQDGKPVDPLRYLPKQDS